MTDRYPGAAPGVFRISNSDLETFLHCGYDWDFRRQSDHRHATVPMLIGTAVAHSAYVDNATKMDGGRLTLPEFREHAVYRYEEEAGVAEIPQSRLEIDRGKDDAADAARAYGEWVAPEIPRPLSAEEKMIAIVDPGIELAGTPDCIAEDVVRDTKTGQPWTQQRADRSGQLTGYSLLYEARHGRPPSRVAIDSVYRGRGQWVGTTFMSRRTERDYEAFLSRMRAARRAMEAGILLPAHEGSWRCALNKCPWWNNGRCKVRPGA